MNSLDFSLHIHLSNFCYHKYLYLLLSHLKINLSKHLIPLPLPGLPDSNLAPFNAVILVYPKYF